MERKPCILVIDDNPTNLRLLFDYLKEDGFKTLIAEDGEEGISHATIAQPDLILLDMMMPGLSGLETCRLLKQKEETRHIPIIFITALSGVTDKVKGFQAGAVDYITKPFQQEEVLARIRTHLTIRRQREELAELNRRLSKLNATKDKFFSIIAHDMRNAFNSLFCGSQFLLRVDTLERTDIKFMAGEMHSSLQNVFKLLENLLSWARVQRGMMEFAPERFDFRELSTESVGLFEESACRKGIELTCSVSPDAHVFADKNMSATVLRNLISNAVKFCDRGDSIHITAREEREELLEICVRDTGTGIPSEDIPRLFQIEGHYKQPGTAQEKGTGLGLILCREFVHRQGGDIWVESSSGQGSSFYFTLPREDRS